MSIVYGYMWRFWIQSCCTANVTIMRKMVTRCASKCKVGHSKKSRGKLASQLNMKYYSRSWPIRLIWHTWFSVEHAVINGNVAMQGPYGVEYPFTYSLFNAICVYSVIKLFTGNWKSLSKSMKLILTEKNESVKHNYSDRHGRRNKQCLSNSIACSR